MDAVESSPKEYAKFALVVVAVAAAAAVAGMVTGETGIYQLTRWFMGCFLVTLATFKLIGYRMFPDMFAMYDLLAGWFKPYAYAYPFIELGLGTTYLLNVWSPWRDWATLAIMLVGALGVVLEMRRHRVIRCACLGNVIKLPLNKVSLIEDLSMAAMSALMIFGH
jgi:hypothetical protein